MLEMEKLFGQNLTNRILNSVSANDLLTDWAYYFLYIDHFEIDTDV